jgi:DnaD/phage-associated family protein
MAKYRQVHTTFWNDSFVLDLTPEEKYFYLYLMTNDQTTQCGIYELPKRIIEMQTGYNRETVDKLLARFEEYEKVKYHEPTKEVFMTNWAKYNWINSVKVITCIDKELKTVKYKGFVSEYIEVLKGYGYRIDTLSIDLGEEEEEEEEENKNTNSNSGENPYTFYLENIKQKGFTVSPFDSDLITQLENQYGLELLMASMKVAAKNNADNIGYVEAILHNWELSGVKTLEQAREHERRFKEKQTKVNVKGHKKQNQIDWENL